MQTLDEKMKEIEINIQSIRAVNDVLLDSISYSEYSGDGDYILLLELQNEHIRKITDLF